MCQRLCHPALGWGQARRLESETAGCGVLDATEGVKMAGIGRRRVLGALLVGAVLGLAGLGPPAQARTDSRSECDRPATRGGCSQQAPCRNGDRSSPCRDCYYQSDQPCRDCYYQSDQPCREGRPQSCPDCYEGDRDDDCYDRCDECYRGDDEASEDDEYADDGDKKDGKDERKSDDDKKKDDKEKDEKKHKERSRLGKLVREIFD
jgi:hypothetical protein